MGEEDSDTFGIPPTANIPNVLQDKPVFKQNPISIMLPSNLNDKIYYKNFIINSLNRDWARSPVRNLIKFNITFDLYHNTFYPQCVCFPKHVKQMTPYVLMNISDASKNMFYSLTCTSSSNDSNWDIWYPVENSENIILQNKTWTIKFYDFTNNELELGADDMHVEEVSKQDNNYVLKFNLPQYSYDNNFMPNDMINIRINNGKTYLKKVISYEKGQNTYNTMTINDDKNELILEDFINSTIMNTKNQYSVIIKYHYNQRS